MPGRVSAAEEQVAAGNQAAVGAATCSAGTPDPAVDLDTALERYRMAAELAMARSRPALSAAARLATNLAPQAGTVALAATKAAQESAAEPAVVGMRAAREALENACTVLAA